jgi:hypothetical protein
VRNIISKVNLPSSTHETSPLLVGIIGISIPVSLLIVAAVTESTFILVFAILAMFAVAAATLGFILVLTSYEPEEIDVGGIGVEGQATH